MTIYVRRRPKRLDVYTDGAVSAIGKTGRGPGGWAWATSRDHYDSGGDPSTTNQRMELQAALEGILANPGPLCIVTDSAYTMNCFTEGWYRGWKNGKKRNGDPVSNWDIWERLIRQVLAGDVTFRKVKGHSGDKGNDFVDALAVAAKREFMK